MADFETAYQKISELVTQFEANESYYISAKYQESEVRTDFLDKFWIALGWDVRHKYQTNPREQEVKVERNPDSSASNRKADYAFYIKPQYRDPAFFVEAKKPSRKLADTENYFQTVRYGYNASTPVCVLTDFEEFHIIDCRYEPNREKSFPSAQIKTFHYKDYLDREKFGEIYWLFSHEALEAGKLKEFVKELPKQRGKGKQKLTSDELHPVDEGFLNKLEEYRLTLAKAFKKADEALTAEELTEATQKVIDRLVFIRFLEDKAIEADYIVDQIAAKGRRSAGILPASRGTTGIEKGAGGTPALRTAWQSFIAWSKELDVKYNGVVFKAHDIDKPSFKAPDDEVFRELCSDISHHRSHYLFSLIPIEILGSIYERFLGKVVTATAKRADIEEKPEVRKAGGVYYTPKYIVDYIVANTVGKLIEGKTPKEISKFRFADIACGSGSFLIAVYDTVLHYVEKYYNEHKEEAAKAGCVEIDKGIYALSLKQKQRILLDNIFGVDIDRQAVEVAQLSLFLKLLENESGAGTGQLTFEKTKILPDLSKNIVNGNSLVEYDISDLFPLSAEDEARIKPFDFRSAFKEIMASGGFDAIVGNPPWVSLTGKFGNDILTQDELTYLIKKYKGNTYMPNIYEYFIARVLDLCKAKGYASLIVPDRFAHNTQFNNLRLRVLEGFSIERLLFKAEFPGIVADTLVFVLRKQITLDDSVIEVTEYKKFTVSVKQKDYLSEKNYSFVYYQNISEKNLFNKLENNDYSKRLIEICETTSGFGGKSSLITTLKENDNQIPVIKGDSISRYILLKQYWFEFDKKNITGRTTDRNKLGAVPKVLLRKTGDRIIATFEDSAIFPEQSLYFMFNFKYDLNPRYVLAILNSKLMNFYYASKCLTNKSSIAQVKKVDLDILPIITLVLTNATDKQKHDALVKLVDQMLETKKRLTATQRESEREQLERKCSHLDHEIDRLVYELYGLTEEEIRIVEGVS